MLKNLSIVFVGLLFLYSCRLLDDTIELSRHCKNSTSCKSGYECQDGFCQYVVSDKDTVLDSDQRSDIFDTLADESEDTVLDSDQVEDIFDTLVDEPEDTSIDPYDTEAEDSLIYDSAEVEEECEINPCGGCGSLDHELGSPCGECGSHQCSGTELFCQDTGRNPCGGCEYPGHEPGDLCNFGYYKCEGDSMICEDSRHYVYASSCAPEHDCDNPMWGEANIIDSDLSTAWSSIERDDSILIEVEWIAFWFDNCDIDHIRIWPYVFNGNPQHFPELIEIHKSTDNGWVLMEVYYDLDPNHLPYHRLEFATVRTEGLLIRGITMTDDGEGHYYFRLAEVSIVCLDDY